MRTVLTVAGSDSGAVQTRAERAEYNGKPGWRINGNKAWCTFAGRANVLAMLVRTDPERNLVLVAGSLPGARNALILVKKA